MKNSKHLQEGFTLIEMLIVVMVIGVLAGLSVAIINPNQQKGRAEDGVRLKNIKATAEAMESYNQLEATYPPNESIEDDNSLLYEVYLDKWPGDDYKYDYDETSDVFVLEVVNSLGQCYKYQSDWAQVMQCPATECALNDGQSPDVSSFSNCSQL